MAENNWGTPKVAHVTVKKTPGMSIDLMLKIFKRKVKDSGILERYKEKTEYIKPSERRKNKHNAAKKRQQREEIE